MENNYNNEIIYLIGERKTVVSTEYIEYLYSNQMEVNNVIACEYQGLFCRKSDVIKIIDLEAKTIDYIAKGEDIDHHYILKYPGDINPWRHEEGKVDYIYKALQKNKQKTLKK